MQQNDGLTLLRSSILRHLPLLGYQSSSITGELRLRVSHRRLSKPFDAVTKSGMSLYNIRSILNIKSVDDFFVDCFTFKEYMSMWADINDLILIIDGKSIDKQNAKEMWGHFINPCGGFCSVEAFDEGDNGSTRILYSKFNVSTKTNYSRSIALRGAIKHGMSILEKATLQ